MILPTKRLLKKNRDKFFELWDKCSDGHKVAAVHFLDGITRFDGMYLLKNHLPKAFGALLDDNTFPELVSFLSTHYIPVRLRPMSVTVRVLYAIEKEYEPFVGKFYDYVHGKRPNSIAEKRIFTMLQPDSTVILGPQLGLSCMSAITEQAYMALKYNDTPQTFKGYTRPLISDVNRIASMIDSNRKMRSLIVNTEGKSYVNPS